jgi:hypothetical protein
LQKKIKQFKIAVQNSSSNKYKGVSQMAVQSTEDFVPETDDFSMESIEARPEGNLNTGDAIKSGWDAAAEALKPKEYVKDFKLSETLQVIKFLDPDGPYAIYSQHFLTQKTEGQRSYTCLGSGCPLCVKLNHKPEKKYGFSIAVLTPTETTLTKLVASPLFFKSLHAAHHSPAGPLSKNYWAVSRRGQMQHTVYTLNPVKGRDLLEDYGLEEAKIEEAIAEMTAFTSDSVRKLSVDELNEVANALI